MLGHKFLPPEGKDLGKNGLVKIVYSVGRFLKFRRFGFDIMGLAVRNHPALGNLKQNYGDIRHAEVWSDC